MAPNSPIAVRPSLKRKFTSRDEILQKWRTDINFKADREYRNKCQTLMDAKEELVQPSHPSRNCIIKKSKKSSCVNDALKLLIQDCIGRIDKIDDKLEKYKKNPVNKENLPRDDGKWCCECTCFQNNNPSKIKVHTEKEMCSSNIDLNSVSVKDRSALDLNGVNVIDEVPSNMFYMNECATLPVDISNVGTEINLAGSTEDKVSLHKLVATCPTLLNTVLSTRNTQSKVSYTPKNEIIGIKPTIDKSPSTTPATYRIISNKRSKAKESWFEANIQDFENSPDVQRGRPSLHILKDKGIVQSLTKQFS